MYLLQHVNRPQPQTDARIAPAIPPLRLAPITTSTPRQRDASRALRFQRDLTLAERQLVLRRSVHLNEADRLLIKQLLADGRTYRDLAAIVPAALANPSDPLRIHTQCGSRFTSTVLLLRSVRRLRRRFARLAARLLSDECTYLLSPDVIMCPTRYRVCFHRFIRGDSVRQISALLSLPLHIVRRICDNTSAHAAAYVAQQPSRAQLN